MPQRWKRAPGRRAGFMAPGAAEPDLLGGKPADPTAPVSPPPGLAAPLTLASGLAGLGGSAALLLGLPGLAGITSAMLGVAALLLLPRWRHGPAAPPRPAADERLPLTDELRHSLDLLAHAPASARVPLLAVQARLVLADLEQLSAAADLVALGDAAEDWRDRVQQLCAAAEVPLVWTCPEPSQPLWLDAVGQVRVHSMLRQLLVVVLPQVRHSLWLHLEVGADGVTAELAGPPGEVEPAPAWCGRALPLALRGQLRRLGVRFIQDVERRSLRLRMDLLGSADAAAGESIASAAPAVPDTLPAQRRKKGSNRGWDTSLAKA